VTVRLHLLTEPRPVREPVPAPLVAPYESTILEALGLRITTRDSAFREVRELRSAK